MDEAYGVPVEEIVKSIKYGVRKVNIDTDLRMAATGGIRKFLVENPKEFDPRKYSAAAKAAKMLNGMMTAQINRLGGSETFPLDITDCDIVTAGALDGFNNANPKA